MPTNVKKALRTGRHKTGVDGQEQACLDAIRQVHALQPTIELGDVSTWQRRVRRDWIDKTYSIAKYSPSGELIGWYRKGQKAGKPNMHMPVAQAVLAAIKAHATALGEARAPVARARSLGQQSGAARKKNALAHLILVRLALLSAQGIPSHQQVKRIAKELPCSLEYVRRVRRSALLTKSRAPSEKILPEQD